MKKLKALIMLLLIFLWSFPLYAVINVGTVFFYPPYVLSNGTGFDISLINVLCTRMKENCVFKTMHYNDLYTNLNNGKIDIAIGGITIDSAPSEEYIYSLPYVLSKGSFLISKDSSYNTTQDLKGASVGILQGPHDGQVFRLFLETQFPDMFTIVNYSTMEDLINALTDGKVNAIFTHESTCVYWQQNSNDKFKTLGNPMIVGDGIGILSTPTQSNINLINNLNMQIRQFEMSQLYMQLYTSYFGDER